MIKEQPLTKVSVGKAVIEDENSVPMQDFSNPSRLCLMQIIARGGYHNIFSLLREVQVPNARAILKVGLCFSGTIRSNSKFMPY